MAEINIAGIMRAGAYSPNHIGNDTAIFNAVAEQLRKRGCIVNTYSEELERGHHRQHVSRAQLNNEATATGKRWKTSDKLGVWY